MLAYIHTASTAVICTQPGPILRTAGPTEPPPPAGPQQGGERGEQ